MLKYLSLLPLLLMLSCTPAKHLARFERRHSELFKKDTVWRYDTLRTAEVSHDTLFRYDQKDTIVVKDGKLTVKYYYTRDSVYLKGTCAPDTVIKKVPYQVNNQPTVAPAEKSHWLRWLLIGMSIGAGALIGLYILIKIR